MRIIIINAILEICTKFKQWGGGLSTCDLGVTGSRPGRDAAAQQLDPLAAAISR